MSKEEKYKKALELVLDYYENRTDDTVELDHVINKVKHTLCHVNLLLPWKQQSLRLDYGNAKAGSVVIQGVNGNFICVMGDGPNPDKFHEYVVRAELICKIANNLDEIIEVMTEARDYYVAPNNDGEGVAILRLESVLEKLTQHES